MSATFLGNSMGRISLLGLWVVAAMTMHSPKAHPETVWLDLTHPIPTFKPVAGNPTKTDYNAPWRDSRPHITWYEQAILTISHFSTSTANYPSGKLIIDEHYGTHLDANNHTINVEETLVEGGIPNDKRRDMSELGTDDLIGPIVLIDIGPRVRAELEKNGGRPSPDVSVTDFSDKSPNVVTADDISSIADQLVDRAWIVVNMDWARFFFDDDISFQTSPYLNDYNHPGFSRAAVDRLAEIIDERDLKLGGIAIDNITVDAGEGARSKWRGGNYPPWHSHTVLMQRNVLFVENLSNVQELAETMNSGAACTLVIGALKHVRGTGGPARVLAMCQS